jgi:hypothetical protein
MESLGNNKLKVLQPGDASSDDVVMGGTSSSTFDSNTGIWTGTVTTVDSYGGFIGIRSVPGFLWN